MEISRPIHRTLRLLDPRLSDKYRDALHAELSQHRVFEKCEELRRFSIQGTWSAHLEDIYHQLDDTITKSMLSAECSIKKVFSRKFAWSPKLKAAVQAYRFWRLKLKQANGQHVSQEVLIRHAFKGGIPLQSVTNTDVSYIVQIIKLSYHNLTDMQSQHANL